MCVYIYTHARTHTHIQVCVYIYIHTHAHAHTHIYTYIYVCVNKHVHVEVKCQLDATEVFTADLIACCLWYFVLWFSSCWSGVELRVMCPVCSMLLCNILMMGIVVSETC